ncbi:MAG TPA: hypothetical protein VGE31_01000 [Candidatus Paceibacterota bacterium]
MKKQHDTIESLLETGKNTGLSASEHSEMWQSLKEYAEFHPAKKSLPYPVFMNVTKWLAVSASALLFVIGTGAASTSSLPGEPLYQIKVGVVEPVVGYTKFNETEQLTYQAQLLERRLFEMQELLDSKQLNEQTVSELEIQVEEHGSEIQELLESDTDESITSETKLEVLTDVVTTLRTHEFIEDTKVSKERSSKFEETEDVIATLYVSEVQEFAAEQPQEAAEYIKETIQEINEMSDEVATTSPSFLELNDYLEDVEDALDTGSIDKALQYTGEAQQTIELNQNIEALEEND